MLAFENGLHGRTLLTMTLTSKAGPSRIGAQIPMLPYVGKSPMRKPRPPL